MEVVIFTTSVYVMSPKLIDNGVVSCPVSTSSFDLWCVYDGLNWLPFGWIVKALLRYDIPDWCWVRLNAESFEVAFKWISKTFGEELCWPIWSPLFFDGPFAWGQARVWLGGVWCMHFVLYFYAPFPCILWHFDVWFRIFHVVLRLVGVLCVFDYFRPFYSTLVLEADHSWALECVLRDLAEFETALRHFCELTGPFGHAFSPVESRLYFCRVLMKKSKHKRMNPGGYFHTRVISSKK